MKRTPLKIGKKTIAHKKACRDFLEWFKEEHDYLYCEICDRSDRQYSAHHIMNAAKFSHHPNFHDHANIICLCFQCHSKIERHELECEKERLIEERKLNELFMK
jgi:hypothetical protein